MKMIRVYAPLHSMRKDGTIEITWERLKAFEDRLDFGKTLAIRKKALL